MNIKYNLKILGEKVEYDNLQNEFINSIENSDSKIFEINAESGSGKTFLLNLIAYSCFADKLEDNYILKSIKKSITRYNDIDSYNLNYELHFQLPDGNKLILTKNENNERIFILGDKKDSDYKELHKKISILYDVPNEPNERLNSVIKDLGIWNNNLQIKLTNYWNYLGKLKNGFDDIRDPIKIERTKSEIEESENQLSSLEKSITETKEIINLLNNYTIICELIENYNQIIKLNSRLSILSKEFRNLQKPDKNNLRDENRLIELKNNFSKEVNEFKLIIIQIFKLKNNELLRDLFLNKPELKDEIDFFNDFNLENFLKLETFENEEKIFYNKIGNIQNQILNYIDTEENGQKSLIFNFLNDFKKGINILVENEAESIVFDIFNQTAETVNNLIDVKINFFNVSDFSSIKILFREKVKGLKNKTISLIQINKTIEKELKKSSNQNDDIKYFELKSEIDNLKNSINSKENTIATQRFNLAQNLNLTNSSMIKDKDSATTILSQIKTKIIDRGISINEVKENINFLDKKLNQKKSEYTDLKNFILRLETLLEIEEQKKDNQFSLEEQTKIISIHKKLGFIIRNIQSYNSLISKINTGDLDKFNQSEDLDFIKIAGKIIAFSMDNKILRRDGKYIKLENFDMINNIFECENNIKIKKEDIANGLASGNYLMQRIQNLKGDYNIILLDEIGNMSETVLKEVIQKIKELQNQNRLILAILVKPTKETNVIPL